MEILYHPRVRKGLRRIPKKFRLQIAAGVEELSRLTHPLQHAQVIKLAGRSSEDFRLRSGDYRIKFTLRNRREIVITDIETRQVGY